MEGGGGGFLLGVNVGGGSRFETCGGKSGRESEKNSCTKGGCSNQGNRIYVLWRVRGFNGERRRCRRLRRRGVDVFTRHRFCREETRISTGFELETEVENVGKRRM